jgi:hypothetical protein
MPGVTEETAYGLPCWKVQKKMFAWDRPLRRADLAALGDAAPRGPILGLITADLEMKDVFLSSDPRVFFTTPHFDGYAAVLARLDVIKAKDLKAALLEAWLARAPKRLADEYIPASKRRV